MRLDPNFWDGVSKEERYVVLRGSVLASGGLGFNARNWEKPRVLKSRDYKPIEPSETTLAHIRETWRKAEERLSRRSAIRPIKFGGHK